MGVGELRDCECDEEWYLLRWRCWYRVSIDLVLGAYICGLSLVAKYLASTRKCT